MTESYANQDYRSAPRYPAWLFSLVLHASLVPLVIFMFAPSAPKGLGVGAETTREISIVVARDQRYEAVRSPSSEAAAAQSKQAASFLPPSTEETPLLPEMELPSINLPKHAGLVGAPSTLSARGSPQATTTFDYSNVLADAEARRAARAAQGNSVNMSLFGGPNAQGRSFVFVIDRSKSMGTSGLDALSDVAVELETALSHLEPVHRFTVIAYHHQPYYLDGRKLLPATEENKKRIAKFFRSLAAFGQTEHEMGLKAALFLNPDVVYLMTDGGLPALDKPKRDLIRREARRSGSTIHCIHFGTRPRPQDGHFMMLLAKENAGGYSYVRKQ